MEAKEIAVRLYENKKYGTTYGKGLFHSAVFNGSADVLGSNTKYLLDYYPYPNHLCCNCRLKRHIEKASGNAGF